MSVDGRKDMARKIPKWETELWSYISNSDGTHCPLYDSCQLRLRGCPCFDDNGPLIRRFHEVKRCYPKDYYGILTNDADFVNLSDQWTLGKIFRLVEKLAQKYLKKGGVSSPPVPAELVSLADEDSAIEIHLVPLEVCRGAIWRLKDKWVIQLKADDTPDARRFTLFHEAFHILAHCQATPVFNGPGREEAYFNELLADYFAGCVLMPRAWVLERWAKVNNIGRMARIFGVKESQMWMCLRQLHLV